MNAPTSIFLVLVCVLVPYAAIKSNLVLARMGDAAFQSRKRHSVTVLVTQAILVTMALVAARSSWIELFPRPALDVQGLGAGALVLALAVGTVPLRWRLASESRRRRLRLIVPREGSDFAWWLAVSLAAGIGEEIVYRGTLFQLVLRITESWVPAALFCSLVFAVAHMVQGWKSSAVVFLFAMAFHGLVYLTGALYLAMAVHFLYDAIAGIVYGKLGRELEPARSVA